MPKQTPDTVEVRPVEVNALGITYQVQIEGGGTIAYEAKLDDTCSRDNIDELLDRIHGATERLIAKNAIVKARQRVTMLKARIKVAERDYEQTASLHMARWGTSRRQGEFRRTDAQEAELGNRMSTIATFRADLPMAEWEVSRLQALIDGTEAPPEPSVEIIQTALEKQAERAKRGARPAMAEAAD